MSTIAKTKPPQVSLQSSARLFNQLGVILSRQGQLLSAQDMSATLSQTVQQLHHHASRAEIILLRDVMRELGNQVERLIPDDDSSALAADTDADADVLERARREDAMAKIVLEAASQHGNSVMSTMESIRNGDEAMAWAENNAAATTASRIANHELISSRALQRALDVKRQAISAAVKAKRLFAIVGPSGENYYPAYYADATLDRRALEQVSKALGSLPAQSKHHFFTSESTVLQQTPLNALRQGRQAEVLAAAAGFAER